MELFKSNYHIIATLLFVTIILIAHLFSTSNYDWTNNTISDLGAQGYDRKIIMQIGFLSFGIFLAAGIISNGLSFPTLPILIYAICIALTGIFCTKPFLDIQTYSSIHSKLHSIFAQVAGVTFSMGILIHFFFTPDKNLKLIHLLFFVLIIGLSATFGLLKSNQGIAQRVLYLTSFLWLIKYYKP